ncbi:MAG: hypothetical protein L6V85_04650 [Clostridiales bacterium]|nr:MAG: hypothetical protein L6V85_04650 [Clostridiales bacterium]
MSCKYQESLLRNMTVAYCGVEGAFAHIAAKKMFPTATYKPCATFSEAYEGVEKGDYDCAVLPLENSYAGEVGEVMDLTFSGDLHINQVIEVPITHNLLALPGASVDTIKTVVSHPQALMQCADFIKKNNFEVKTYSNTALAAKFVKDSGDKTIAALASDETANVFGLDIIEKKRQRREKPTRRDFAAFSRVEKYAVLPYEKRKRKLYSGVHGTERIGRACKRVEHNRRTQLQYARASFPSDEKPEMELLFLHRGGRKRQYAKRKRTYARAVRALRQAETCRQLLLGRGIRKMIIPVNLDEKNTTSSSKNGALDDAEKNTLTLTERFWF